MAFDFRLPDYLRSTDFKTFEGAYKIMFGAIKKDINGITDLKDVDKCAEHMLPLLAGFIGCDYFSETTPEVNRLIIKNWWWLMKNKGTLRAIQTAASLGLIAYDNAKHTNPGNAMYGRTVEIVLDIVTGEIFVRVAYQQLDEEVNIDQTEQQAWMKKMIEYVRPAGYKVTLVPSQFTKAFINAISQHDVRISQMTYSVDFQSGLSHIDYEINEASIPVECISKFGHYNPADVVGNPCIVIGAGECPYRLQCKEFTEKGIGQQEISGLDGVERYPGPVS